MRLYTNYVLHTSVCNMNFITIYLIFQVIFLYDVILSEKIQLNYLKTLLLYLYI